MNVRHVLASLLAASTVVLVGAGAAQASTNPDWRMDRASSIDIAACVQARLRVADAGREANAAADALAKVQATIDASLQANVDKAEADLTAALKAVANPPTAAQLAEVAKAEINLQAALKALEDKASPSQERNNLQAAKDKLRSAVEKAQDVCDRDKNNDGRDDDEDTPKTTTPAPTTSSVPSVIVVPSTPVNDNNGGVTVAPRGGVETGLL